MPLFCVSATEFLFIIEFTLKLWLTVLIPSTYIDLCYHVLVACTVNATFSKNSVEDKQPAHAQGQKTET